MSIVLSNEQRAHDFACAVLANEFLVKAQIEFAEQPNSDNVLDITKVYTRMYNGALRFFEKNST